MSKTKTRPLAAARAVLEAEAAALRATAARLDAEFARVVKLIRAARGHVVVAGLGKSGLVARSLAATLSSLGTPAVFLHAAEAVHGDIGLVGGGDVALLVSRSGATPELVRLLPLLRARRAQVVALVGNRRSALAERADAVLDASVGREADPLGLAPTSSVIAALGLGHALACALAQARGFTADDFARAHPSGQLGRNLLLRVADVMHGMRSVAAVTPRAPVRDVVMAMTQRPLGAACVLDGAGRLLGLVTDGDVRRALQQHDDIRPLKVADVMTAKPLSIGPTATLARALRMMEERASQISVLPVVDARGRCSGLLRLHDIYQHLTPLGRRE